MVNICVHKSLKYREETDGAAYEMQRINETVQERVLDGKHIVSDPVR